MAPHVLEVDRDDTTERSMLFLYKESQMGIYTESVRQTQLLNRVV
jgi:hypothetical protein